MDASKVVFIGGGNMASALIGGLRKAGRGAHSVIVVEPLAEPRARLQQAFGVAAVAAADSSLAGATLVVWAVKPQRFTEAAAPCAPFIGGALHLSVMAGIPSAAIVRAAGSERVVRAMPNTPALIGRGITALYAREAVSAGERAVIEQMLAPTGATLWVTREQDLDAVTAVSGSGPAYVYYVLEAMMRAAHEMGLSDAQGRALALATFDGATALAQASPLSPQALRAQVTSQGGTTHAAITSLEADGVADAVVRALHAARARAAELGREFG